jgi:hypothetical protein
VSIEEIQKLTAVRPVANDMAFRRHAFLFRSIPQYTRLAAGVANPSFSLLVHSER